MRLAAKIRDDARSATDETVEVPDCEGYALIDGDRVITIKDLKMKNADRPIRNGTVIKSIRLAGGSQEIDCRLDTRAMSCARNACASIDQPNSPPARAN